MINAIATSPGREATPFTLDASSSEYRESNTSPRKENLMPARSSPHKSSRRRKKSDATAAPTEVSQITSAGDLDELINREEPLRKKYMRYVIERHGGGRSLVHPVLHAPVIRLDRCAYLHREIETGEAVATELLGDGNVYGFVCCHTAPFRVAAFRKALRKLGAKIKDKDYWQTLRLAYETNENPSGHCHTFRRWLAARRRSREYFMELEERDLLRRLPDSFTVYRGYSRFRGEGMSWTLDRRVADWFAHRRADWGQPRVITGLVRRDDVLALLESAGEAEVLVPHGLVTQQVHGPAAEGEMPFSVFEYAKPRLDIESLCVRKPSRPGSRKRPASTPRKQTARSKLRPR